ncbi:MAG: hypothetical protein AB7U63_12370 [Porticoccaceae bacterium]
MENYAIIKDGVVTNLIVLADGAEWVPPSGHECIPASNVGVGWKFINGEFIDPSKPEPLTVTPEQIRAQKVAIVQNHMDAAARVLNYDSISNAITYAEEPAVPKLQQEGQAFRAWRSLVWAKCYEILDAVNAGTRDIPTDEELIAELPALQLPA